jgi:hypothetical protein
MQRILIKKDAHTYAFEAIVCRFPPPSLPKMAEMNYIFFLSVGQLQRIFTLGGGERTLQTNAAVTVGVIIKAIFEKIFKTLAIVNSSLE